MSSPSKPDFYYRQSAALPYRMGSNGLEVLLITTMKRKRWILPKGIVESGMTPAQSAAAEAFEEAGVSGEVGDRLLGTYEIEKWGGTCRVEVYPLAVNDQADDWPEADFRDREWLAFKAAAERTDLPALREIILSAAESLG